MDMIKLVKSLSSDELEALKRAIRANETVSDRLGQAMQMVPLERLNALGKDARLKEVWALVQEILHDTHPLVDMRVPLTKRAHDYCRSL